MKTSGCSEAVNHLFRAVIFASSIVIIWYHRSVRK